MADDIQVTQDADDPTLVHVNFTLNPSFIVGQQAGVLRAAGADINPSVPDCAVAVQKDGGVAFQWVEATVVIDKEVPDAG